MNILRKIGLAFCAFLLPFTLLGLAFSHAASATIFQPDTLKRWLDESNFYERIVDTTLQTASEDASLEKGESDVLVKDPEVQRIAKQVFNADYVRGNIEQVLDGVYGWLEGETDKPTFSINLSEAKQRFADELGKYATSRARSLPACSAAQLRELARQGGEFDALSADCLPRGVDPKTAGAAVRSEALANDDFLDQTNFTGDDLSIGADDRQRLQDAYQQAQRAPYFFAGLAILLAAGIVLLSPRKRLGVRRVGIMVVTAGIILGLLRLAFSSITRFVEEHASRATDGSRAGSELASALLRTVDKDVSGIIGWYALAFVLVGIGGVLMARFFNRQDPDTLDQSTAGAGQQGITKKPRASRKNPW